MRIEVSVTAFAATDPELRTPTRGALEVLPDRIAIYRQRRGVRNGMDRCDVYLGSSERAQLALELVLGLSPTFVIGRLGVGDRTTQLLQMLEALAEPLS